MGGALALLALWFLAYWLGMASLIWIDGKRQRRAIQASGSVDFVNRSPWPYILMGILCGPLPLILYFGTTRKSAAGWVAGIAIGVGWTLLFSFLYTLIDAYGRTIKT
jgi:hypothetical protein